MFEQVSDDLEARCAVINPDEISFGVLHTARDLYKWNARSTEHPANFAVSRLNGGEEHTIDAMMDHCRDRGSYCPVLIPTVTKEYFVPLFTRHVSH